MRISFNTNNIYQTQKNYRNTSPQRPKTDSLSFGNLRPVRLENRFAYLLKNEMERLNILPRLKQTKGGWVKESDCDPSIIHSYLPEVAKELIVSRRIKHPNIPRLHTWWRIGAENNRICRLDFSVKKNPIRIQVDLKNNGDNIIHIDALEKLDTPYEFKITEHADGTIERLKRKNSEWVPVKV